MNYNELLSTLSERITDNLRKTSQTKSPEEKTSSTEVTSELLNKIELEIQRQGG